MKDYISLEDVVGTVILYNSSNKTFENIHTYINQVTKLYVVDNSTNYNHELIDKISALDKVHYHSLSGNKGIAAALNWAADQAIKDNYLVLLTMDDDTRTPDLMVEKMLDFWNQYSHKIGILSGVHHDRPATKAFNKVPFTLTSGNLLSLIAYKLVGSFREDFFIDHVDHEYGFRLNKYNYDVVELPDIHLDHQLGITKNLKIGSIQLRTYGTNTPIRLYYYARNGMYISKLYFKEHPWFAWLYTKEMIRRWIKTLVLDTNRLYRARMLLKGIINGWHGNLGNYLPDLRTSDWRDKS
ncbi:glycosyltransferase [Fibrella aquatica]|uniref:glycosyltransferase n=1 Tax=Fibrella aquatica TaxID=3242487 RepID=UPI00351F89C8